MENQPRNKKMEKRNKGVSSKREQTTPKDGICAQRKEGI
jgi:hypothetical protein